MELPWIDGEGSAIRVVAVRKGETFGAVRRILAAREQLGELECELQFFGQPLGDGVSCWLLLGENADGRQLLQLRMKQVALHVKLLSGETARLVVPLSESIGDMKRRLLGMAAMAEDEMQVRSARPARRSHFARSSRHPLRLRSDDRVVAAAASPLPPALCVAAPVTPRDAQVIYGGRELRSDEALHSIGFDHRGSSLLHLTRRIGLSPPLR